MPPVTDATREKGVPLPEGFDETQHCGGWDRDDQIVCMKDAGWGTQHLGIGRCREHGGNAGMVPGRSRHVSDGGGVSQERPRTIYAKAYDMERSPALLSIDAELALLKSVNDVSMALYVAELEAWMSVHAKWAAGDLNNDDGVPPAEPKKPEMDYKLLELVAKFQSNAFNQRLSRHNSIPVTEIKSVLQQVVGAFSDVCDKYGIPNEARIEFASKMQSIKLSRPDFQLDKAQGSEGAGATVIDHDNSEAAGG